MFNTQQRLFLISLGIVILLLLVPAGIIMLNTDMENTNQSSANNENEIALDLDQAQTTTTTVDITDSVTIKKVDPNEIFGQSPRDFDVPDINDGTINIKHGTNYDSSSTGSRGNRADAGDNAATATQLIGGGNWINDSVLSHEDPNNPNQYITDDEDWFYIFVQEKGNLETQYIVFTINNSAPPSTTQPRELRCYIYDPISIILNQDNYPLSGPLSGKTMSITDGEMGIFDLDYERIGPWEESTLDASPPISGAFLIRILCISQNYNVHYNITSIQVNTIKPVSSPHDMNNYPENASVPLTEPTKDTPIQGKLTQHKDHWDWYEISNFIEYHGLAWPNKISFEVDITRESMVANTYYSWTEAWVLYDSELNTNNAYLEGDSFNTGGSPSVTVSGGATVPIKNNFEMQGKHAYIGLRVRSVGITSQGQMFSQRYDGSVDYDLSFSVVLQNIGPILMQGKLDPLQNYYFMDDEITFKVKYRDLDNDPPTYVNVTIDGINYEMSSTSTNYVSGAEYTLKVLCSTLDDSFYPHTFNFSACDGLEPVVLILSPPNNEFKVIEDQTPLIKDTAPTVMEFDEDGDILIIEFSSIFEDIDPMDGLEYAIKIDDTFVTKFESPRIEVFVFQNTKLKFQLKGNQHGYDDVMFRAKETLKRSSDTYTFTKTYLLNISISSQKDAPLLDSIPQVQAYQGEQIYFQISASDPDIYTDDDELIFSSNRSDEIGIDDLESFSIIPDEYDITKANISFTPKNKHVGKFFAEITVTDDYDQSDSLSVEFEITNVNDPPVFKEVKKGSIQTKIKANDTSAELFATEDEWFNITVIVEDIDILIGQSNSINFQIENHTFTNPVSIDFAGGNDQTGQVSVLPLNSDVGINYINITVFDGKGGSDELSLVVDVENVNDAPTVPEIKIVRVNIYTPTEDEREFSYVDTITFNGISTDEDLLIPGSKEELTYTWYLMDAKTDEKLDNDDPVDRVKLQFPTPYLPFDDRKIKPGNYTIKLIVRDSEGEERSSELSFLLKEDFDNDNMPDDWELDFDLDPHDRNDAILDADSDKHSNLDEYKAGTDPRDPSQHPGGKSSEASSDYTLVYIIIVVVIIIVLLLFFVLLNRSRNKKKEVESEVENLAYPSEDDSGLGLGFVGPTAADSELVGMPPGMPMPPPGMPPEMVRQMQMQIMQQMQMQAQKGGGPGPMTMETQQQPQSHQKSEALSQPSQGYNQPGLASAGAGAGSITPKLPPAKDEAIKNNVDDGRHAPIDSVADDGTTDNELGIEHDDSGVTSGEGLELVPGEPGFADKNEIETVEPENEIKKENNRMTCPSCGIEVKSGWFLCPGCKSPLN